MWLQLNKIFEQIMADKLFPKQILLKMSKKDGNSVQQLKIM